MKRMTVMMKKKMKFKRKLKLQKATQKIKKIQKQLIVKLDMIMTKIRMKLLK
jgi:hypothetical protein